MRRTRVAASLLLLLCIRAAAADGAVAEWERAEGRREVIDHDEDRELRVVGVGRVRLSFPQWISGSLGALVVRQPAAYDCTSVCEYRGLLLQAEPGVNGGQLSAGYAAVWADKGRRQRLLSDVFLGYGVKGALLRTWNDADVDPSHQTLLGVEGDFTIIQLNFSLGAFRHVGSGDVDDDWLITGGVGWGF